MPAKTRVELGLELLTHEDVLRLISYDPETGEMVWKLRRPGVTVGRAVGAVDAVGYRRFMLNREHYSAHRVAWFYVHGVWPKRLIDHIDGNHGNNRLLNLREADDVQNQQNRGLRRGLGKSRLLGAHWDGERNCWLARIKVDGRTKHLGRFSSDALAHEAYVAAKNQLHTHATGRP